MSDILLTQERFIQAVCDMMPGQSREKVKRIFSDMKNEILSNPQLVREAIEKSKGLDAYPRFNYYRAHNWRGGWGVSDSHTGASIALCFDKSMAKVIADALNTFDDKDGLLNI